MKDGIKSFRLKFADDTTIFREIRTTENTQQLQEDLDALVKWSKDWQMNFNVEKCKKCTLVTATARQLTTSWKARNLKNVTKRKTWVS